MERDFLLNKIIGELGAALMQQAPTDDKIIMDHVLAAHRSAKLLLDATPDDPYMLIAEDMHTLSQIAMSIEDEGDRAYFASTNDADDLKVIATRLDDERWRRVRSKPSRGADQ